MPAATPAPLAELVTVQHGLLVEHEVVLAAGATASDLTSAMMLVPPRAALVSFHGDVDLSLVFREVSRDRVPPEEAPGEAPGGQVPHEQALSQDDGRPGPA